jgi:hypothetical protein
MASSTGSPSQMHEGMIMESEQSQMSHQSVFHFGQYEVILFPFWEISSPLG